MAMIKRRIMAGGLGAAAIIRRSQAQATDWPNRPVRVIVPYTPGVGRDFIVRAVAERLSR